MDPSTLFEHFAQATTFRNIQQLFYQICISLDIDPTDSGNLYNKISEIDKGKANSKANNLWTLLDKRRSMSEYIKQTACNRLNVLVIGAGPCGLRAAIECALLGANVVVAEQRDKFSRNNVLHLWEFVIQDLKALGAKIFYPKFCTGSIEHISIRQLQCILLKVALVLGVQVHENVAFSQLIEPELDANGYAPGWRAAFEPHGHILSDYEFDALIGADGKRNTLPGFPRQVVRGKLAIGITANFINNKTSAEEKVQEISGVAYIFNQAFFKDMKRETGVDLENIVYYKDATHYFVMCAKKQSLLEKGVIKQDFDDISQLLSRDNVDQEMLCKYAAQAADFATHGKLPQLNYAQNHNGQADIAMFDFTALCSAVYSTRLSERCGRNLIMTIVGDSLHEPFWPTGSGAARGFLGCFDVAWMLRNFGINKMGPTEIIAERENIYKLLAQTTKENMSKAISKYTIDPKTRYPSIEMTVGPHDVLEQVDTDNPRMRPTSKPLSLRCVHPVHQINTPFKRKHRFWRFCHQSLMPFKLKVINFKTQSWGDGRALAALIGKFRSDLVDYISLCSMGDPERMIDTVFSAVESTYNIPRPCEDHLAWAKLSDSARIDYLARIIENLRSDSAALQQILSPTLKAGLARKRTVQTVDTSKAKKSEQIKRRAGDLINSFASTSIWPQNLDTPIVQNGNLNGVENGLDVEKMSEEELMEAKTADVRQKAINGYVEENDKYKEIDEKIKKVDNSMKNRHLAGANMVSRIKEMQKQNTLQNGVTVQKKPPPPPPPLKKPTRTSSDEDQENEKTNVIFRTTPYENSRRPLSVPTPEIYSSVNGRRRQFCALCHSEAYLAEQMIIEKMVIHRKCFKCSFCEQPLRLGNSALDRDLMDKFGPRWFCSQHNILPLHEKIAKIEKLDKKNGVRAASVAIVAPTPVPPSPQKVVSKAEIFLKPEKLIIPSSTNESTKSHYFSARNTPIRHQETIDEPPPKEKQNLHSVNSPSGLLQRTMERLKERQDRLAALGTPPQSTVTVQGITTGERVEFEPTRRKISTSKEMHHFTVNDREDSSHTEEEDVISEEDSEKSMDEFNDGILEGTKTEDEEDIGDEFRTSKPSGEMVKKKNEALTEEESFDDDEIWSEFNEALETTLTQNLDQKISEQQALEIISNFNKRISINQLKTIPNLYVTPPSRNQQTPSINSDKSEYFTPMTSSYSTKREDDDSDDFQTPKARPVLKRSSTESKIEVDANAIRERQIQRYNEMKELHRQQAKLKSDQELEQKHPSNRSSVPSESILYRLHNAYSNEEDGKNRARLDEPETSTKLSILDYMPSLQKVSGRRRSRTRSRSPPPPVLPFTTNQSRQKNDFEKRAGSDEPSFYTANTDSPRKETRANSDITGGVFSRFVNVEDDETALTKTSNPTKGHWFESSPSPNQLRHSESQKEENMLDRMRRLKVRNAERRATVAVNLDRERQQELEKMRRNEQIQDQMDRLKEQQAARKLAKGEDASENGVKLRSDDKMDRQRSKSRDMKLRIGFESNDPSIAISPQNIKRVQRQAQKIIIRREQERQRTAQDIQRGLDETENRISEVFVVGAELETALQKDPKNSWLLENWLLYVQELLQLQLREEDLNMRVKEISVAEQYRQLKFDLQELQSQSGGEIGPNIEIEKRLMEKIIEVLNEHNQIKAEMDEASKSNRKTIFEIQKILENHGRTYQNFEPVFSIDRITASYATKRILLS